MNLTSFKTSTDSSRWSLSNFRSRGDSTLYLIIIAIITFIGLVLRLFALGEESLFMDELSQTGMYGYSFTHLLTAPAQQGQPPLDYMIGAFIQRLGLGGSDWWVRLPAVLFGTGSIFLFGYWIRRVIGFQAAIVATLLLAVCPFHVYFSQEARPYTIFMFFAMACCLMFEYARRRHTAKSWILFTCTLFAMLMTRWIGPHFIAMGLVVYALGAWVITFRKDQGFIHRKETMKLWAVGTSFGVAYALYNPILGVIVDHMRRAINTGKPAAFSRAAALIGEAFQSVIYGYSARTTFSALPGNPWILALLAAFFMIGLLFLVRSIWKKRDSYSLLFALTLLPFPILYALFYALMSNAPSKPQYLFLLTIPVITCIAISIEQIRLQAKTISRSASWLIYATALGFALLPMFNATIHSLITQDKRDWRGVMTYLKENAKSTDAFACIGSDSVPPVWFPRDFGKARYGLHGVKFLQTSLRTDPEKLNRPPWNRTDNTVWIVGYNDTMYTGEDPVPTPTRIPRNGGVQSFNGLFILELHGEIPAVDRLMEGIDSIYQDTPEKHALIAPGVLRGYYFMNLQDQQEADHSFQWAISQCRNEKEKQILIRDYLPEYYSTARHMATSPRDIQKKKAKLVKQRP